MLTYCLRSRLSIFVYIHVLVIYVHGLPYTAYYSRHGPQCDFRASSSYTFLDLAILTAAACGFTRGE